MCIDTMREIGHRQPAMNLKRKKRVLAIDDEPAMTEWLKILLEHAGYEVRTEGEFDAALSAALADTDGSENLSITISGVPAGATLSAGHDNGNGSWTLTQGQLSGLTITPPHNSDVDFTLTVSATATESNGGDTATATAALAVTVNAVANLSRLAAFLEALKTVLGGKPIMVNSAFRSEAVNTAVGSTSPEAMRGR